MLNPATSLATTMFHAAGAAACSRHALPSTAPALHRQLATAALDPMQPYIPDWCTLPKLPGSSSTIRTTEFTSGAYTYASLPPERWPEIAVVGRSNVGKSSLINYLVGSNTIAKVSKHPGKTQSINHFLINRSWYLVDCPGYGYAKVSQDKRSAWSAMTERYFKSRSTLVDILLLIDASLPPKDMDLAGVSWLLAAQLPLTLVFTKTDKVKPRLPPPGDNIAAFRAALQAAGGPHAIPPHFATSAAAKRGREQLLTYLAQRRAQHAAAAQEQAHAMLQAQPAAG